jgi:hypothetical protein
VSCPRRFSSWRVCVGTPTLLPALHTFLLPRLHANTVAAVFVQGSRVQVNSRTHIPKGLKA